MEVIKFKVDVEGDLVSCSYLHKKGYHRYFLADLYNATRKSANMSLILNGKKYPLGYCNDIEASQKIHEYFLAIERKKKIEAI
jgi:hypothetical protein